MKNVPVWADSNMNSKMVKEARIDKAVKFLKSYDINFISNNNGIHIYFWIDDIRFDLWASNPLLWVNNNGNKKIIKDTGNIFLEIEKTLFNIQ